MPPSPKVHDVSRVNPVTAYLKDQKATMAYLDRFEPPELPPGASTLRSQLALGMVFHARQVPPSQVTARLLTTYMVTTDKASREYMAGCRRVRDHMNADGGIQAFFEGVGHFENSINATKRAVRALGRLGTQQGGPAIDRAIRKLAQSQSKAITALRDAIEHMDEGIVSDSGIPDGAPHLLTIDRAGDILEIGTHRLQIVSLQGTLGTLHTAGLAMIHALPRPADC